MNKLASLLSGIIFGIGLVISEMVNPTLKAFMSNEISEKDQGILQGVLNSIVGFTSVIGPISMSYIFSIGASKESLIYSPGAPFLFAGCLFFASLLLIRRFLA